MDDFDRFLTLLRQSRRTVALTGAGVSTLSGIPDFRGPNGLYTRQSTWHGYPVEMMLDTDFFDEHPDLFYEYAREFLYPMTDCTPSIAHEALALLEARGKLAALYTQNIDLLHSKAGSKNVGELHGSFRNHVCRHCGASYGLEPARSEIMAGNVPRCERCGHVLKPSVVFFGDNLDSELLDRAGRDCSSAELLLVLGSSLTVQPVASLPRLTLRHGGALVIVNAQPTDYDQAAACRFPDIAGFCQRLTEACNEQ